MHCSLNLAINMHNRKLLIAGRDTITQTDLAEAVGVTKSTICKLCNSTARVVSFELLERLCEYFDCEPADLLERDAAPQAKPYSAPVEPELDKEARAALAAQRAALAAQERLARAAKGR